MISLGEEGGVKRSEGEDTDPKLSSVSPSEKIARFIKRNQKNLNIKQTGFLMKDADRKLSSMWSSKKIGRFMDKMKSI